ncbi:hypothetical protein [Halorarum salinum]|uniref:DUF7967 domain-containing protein n=1 Tax=Halorarum salinum TaxID=2743089 RepID=A0A7D5Q9A4_9EURY|nr:hypothetical protein [Halobaculum salinum]QLG60798.1 hypothetical protein HUG12_03165 [Halobaculum salinum]
MRLWLVEREYDARQTVSLTYASEDGERYYRRQASVELLGRNPATAAVDRPESDLEAVESDGTKERYAAEARRMAERYDPDEEV